HREDVQRDAGPINHQGHKASRPLCSFCAGSDRERLVRRTIFRMSVPPPLTRRFGLLHATALNMINMIGIGPFITIPLLMTALGGPQAMLGWIVALVIVICDGMVWSEL